jgi:hypothetical protein
MKLNELQQQLQTNFKVKTQGHRLQQTIRQVKIGKTSKKAIKAGQLYLYRAGQNTICQADKASLIITDQADLLTVCNQINTYLLAETFIKNELLTLNFQKYDLDQLLKIINKKLSLELLVCDLNNSIIGSEGIFFKNSSKSIINHKHAIEIRNEMIQLGKFYWHASNNSLLVTADILQTLSRVLCHNLLAQRIVSPLNSPAEVLLVKLLKSQQTTEIEEYFDRQHHPLPKSMSFIYILQNRPDRLAALKRTIQNEFAEFFGFSISSVYQGQLISLVKMPLPALFSAETYKFLQTLAEQLQVKFLVANPVTRMTELRAVHQAALLILKDLTLTRRVHFCAEAALPLFVEQNFNFRLTNYLLNPVPHYLQTYDQQHGTNLLTVLRIYLANSCSISRTAAQLYLHRNSVTNHLRKLERLTGVDYHNFKELQSLQFAFDVYQNLQQS